RRWTAWPESPINYGRWKVYRNWTVRPIRRPSSAVRPDSGGFVLGAESMRGGIRIAVRTLLRARDTPEEFGIVIRPDHTFTGGSRGRCGARGAECFPAQHRDHHDRDECQHVDHVAHLLYRG